MRSISVTSFGLSDFRFSAQATRLGARFDAHHGSADILGLIETDFLGNSPNNVAVTTNSNGLRIRLGWLDFRRPGEVDWHAKYAGLAQHHRKLMERAAFADTVPQAPK